MRRFSDREMAQLRRVPLFEGFPSRNLYRLVFEKLHAGYRVYPKESRILKQGRPMYAVCCLARGEVEAGISQPGKHGKRWTTIMTLEAPAVFGEALAFAGRNCQVEVRTKRECAVYFIPGKYLMQQWQDPDVARVISRILPSMKQKLEILQEQIRTLQEPNLKMRMLRYAHFHKAQRGETFRIPFSEEQLAARLGYGRSALRQASRELEEEGILKTERKQWNFLQDPGQFLRDLPEEVLRTEMEHIPDAEEIGRLQANCENPENARKILLMLCGISIQIELANRELMLQQNPTVRAKLLRELMEAGSGEEPVRIGKSTLADLPKRLQVSRRMLVTVLTQLEEEGVLRKTGDSYQVLIPKERLNELLVNEISGQDVSELALTEEQRSWIQRPKKEIAEARETETEPDHERDLLAGGENSNKKRQEKKTMIDTTMKMREIVKLEPSFGDFLRMKGFPFTVKNPITALVTFEDVVKRKKLDKEQFLKEYEVWKESRRGS